MYVSIMCVCNCMYVCMYVLHVCNYKGICMCMYGCHRHVSSAHIDLGARETKFFFSTRP